MLQPTKNLCGTWNIFVLESGFCVLEVLVDIKKNGLYGTSLIKKRLYYPHYINGEKINAHFTGK